MSGFGRIARGAERIQADVEAWGDEFPLGRASFGIGFVMHQYTFVSSNAQLKVS
jgi:hypothetical protein